MLRVANREASEPAGATRPESADHRAKKRSAAKSLTKAQLLAQLRASQQEVDRLEELWETSVNGLAKLLRSLAKTSGFLSFLENGGLARANRGADQPEVVTSTDILAFLRT